VPPLLSDEADHVQRVERGLIMSHAITTNDAIVPIADAAIRSRRGEIRSWRQWRSARGRRPG
jgi:hypothetical protein